MAFLWRTGTSTEVESPGISFSTALAPRIVISALLVVGLFYSLLMLNTFRQWGDKMDRAWKEYLSDCHDAPQKASYFLGKRKSKRSTNIFDSFGLKPDCDMMPPIGVFVPRPPAPEPIVREPSGYHPSYTVRPRHRFR